MQTLASRLINIGGQLALAWLLIPSDWGLYSLALTVVTFAGVLQRLGLHYVLIQRQARFDRWANAAFWVSLCSGSIASLLVGMLSPWVARLYDSTEVMSLLLVIAPVPLLQGLGLICETRLQARMQFSTLAGVNTLQVGLNMGLTIFLAWRGWGAYSFVIAQVVATAVRTAMLWSVAPLRVQWNPQFRRWRFLLGDAGVVCLSGFFSYVLFQGDLVLLGIFHSEAVVGIYAFAYRLSTQVLQLLSVNLGGVLLPALSKIQEDPSRQKQAFLRAAGVLTLVGVPVCFLQFAAAGPLIRLFFEPKWHAAVPVLQVLSLGMAIRLLYPASQSLLRAQGRFRIDLVLVVLTAIFFIGLVSLGAMWGGATAVAAGTALTFIFVGPIALYLAIRPAGGTWKDTWQAYGPPAVVSAISFGIAMGLSGLIPDVPMQELARLAVIICVGPLIYTLIARRVMPVEVGQLMQRIGQFRSRRVANELAVSISAPSARSSKPGASVDK